MRKFRYVIVAFLIILDQAVKFMVRECMYVGESRTIIENIFSITYVQNRGAAFSLLSGRGLILTALPFIAVITAVWYMEKHKKAHWTMFSALSLIIAGGLGNLIDRVFNGYVTDMFDFQVWPVFNVADIAICLGCGFLMLYMFWFEGKE